MEYERMRFYEREEGREEGLAAGLAEGREKGLVEGRAEGERKGAEQKAFQTARIALENNISLEMIQKLTGLALEQIQSLKAEVFTI